MSGSSFEIHNPNSVLNCQVEIAWHISTNFSSGQLISIHQFSQVQDKCCDFESAFSHVLDPWSSKEITKDVEHAINYISLMTLNISEKYRGILGTSCKCFRTQATCSVIRKKEILRNNTAKCCLTEKSELSRSLWEIKMTLKNLEGILVSVQNIYESNPLA